ncbi:hypothetical protein BJ742DRAFT_884067 [Cladochytrium replicatum]|nr:hypothetical protein BJ742DRAFT_884067 [Cladochytrium replicatum]
MSTTSASADLFVGRIIFSVNAVLSLCCFTIAAFSLFSALVTKSTQRTRNALLLAATFLVSAESLQLVIELFLTQDGKISIVLAYFRLFVQSWALNIIVLAQVLRLSVVASGIHKRRYETIAAVILLANSIFLVACRFVDFTQKSQRSSDFNPNTYVEPIVSSILAPVIPIIVALYGSLVVFLPALYKATTGDTNDDRYIDNRQQRSKDPEAVQRATRSLFYVEIGVNATALLILAAFMVLLFVPLSPILYKSMPTLQVTLFAFLECFYVYLVRTFTGARSLYDRITAPKIPKQEEETYQDLPQDEHATPSSMTAGGPQIPSQSALNQQQPPYRVVSTLTDLDRELPTVLTIPQNNLSLRQAPNFVGGVRQTPLIAELQQQPRQVPNPAYSLRHLPSLTEVQQQKSSNRQSTPSNDVRHNPSLIQMQQYGPSPTPTNGVRHSPALTELQPKNPYRQVPALTYDARHIPSLTDVNQNYRQSSTPNDVRHIPSLTDLSQRQSPHPLYPQDGRPSTPTFPGGQKVPGFQLELPPNSQPSTATFPSVPNYLEPPMRQLSVATSVSPTPQSLSPRTPDYRSESRNSPAISTVSAYNTPTPNIATPQSLSYYPPSQISAATKMSDPPPGSQYRIPLHKKKQSENVLTIYENASMSGSSVSLSQSDLSGSKTMLVDVNERGKRKNSEASSRRYSGISMRGGTPTTGRRGSEPDSDNGGYRPKPPMNNSSDETGANRVMHSSRERSPRASGGSAQPELRARTLSDPAAVDSMSPIVGQTARTASPPWSRKSSFGEDAPIPLRRESKAIGPNVRVVVGTIPSEPVVSTGKQGPSSAQPILPANIAYLYSNALAPSSDAGSGRNLNAR